MDQVDFSTNIEVTNDDNERICGVNLNQNQSLLVLGLIVTILLLILVAASFLEAVEGKEIFNVVKGK